MARRRSRKGETVHKKTTQRQKLRAAVLHKSKEMTFYAIWLLLWDVRSDLYSDSDRCNYFTVGFRKGKDDAMTKLVSVANKENGSITHDYVGKFGSAEVLLKKAPEGTGVIAGGPARAVIELAGIKNIRTKSLGSRNKQNVVLATIAGLSELKTPEEVARLRGKSTNEIFA